MIIIKPVGTYKCCILQIATVMFNMEVGRCVFDKDGKIDHPEKDFGGFVFQGIEYHITGSSGTIYLALTGGNGVASALHQNFVVDIDAYLNELRDKFARHCDKSATHIPVFSKYSHDYVCGGTIGIDAKNTSYKWAVKFNNYTDMLRLPDQKTSSKNAIDYAHIHSSSQAILVDMKNLFVYENFMTMVTGFPPYEDLTIWGSYVGVSIDFSCSMGGIDLAIRKILGIPYPCASDIPVLKDIYTEKWENIRPMRTKGIVAPDLACIREKYDHVLADLEELRDVACGAPARLTDACVTCGILLYGDIYVIEYKDTNHMCICPQCGHSNILNRISEDLTILKVTYPRTVVDLIKQLNLSDCHSKVLLEMSAITTYYKEYVRTPSFIGVQLITDAVDIDTRGKQLFICNKQ